MNNRRCAGRCACGARCEKYCCHEQRDSYHDGNLMQADIHCCKACLDLAYMRNAPKQPGSHLIFKEFRNAGVA